MDQFREILIGACPTAIVEIDQPDDPAGEWWLDIAIGDFSTPVGWRPELGFGLSVECEGYGVSPDEIYRIPDRAVERVLQMEDHFRRNENLSMSLRDLRKLRHADQIAVAKELAVKQATVSRLENRADAKVSTLSAFVRVLGGHLELRAVFDDCSVPVTLGPGPAKRQTDPETA